MKWLALLLAGCAPAWKPDLSSGQRPKHPREIALTCDRDNICTGKHRDIVTQPGGDPTDWFTLDLPHSTCQHGTWVKVTVADAPARPGMYLWATLFDGDDYKVGQPQRIAVVGQLEHGGLEGGRYYLRVTASKGGAGKYKVWVESQGYQGCDPRGDLPQW